MQDMRYIRLLSWRHQPTVSRAIVLLSFRTGHKNCLPADVFIEVICRTLSVGDPATFSPFSFLHSPFSLLHSWHPPDFSPSLFASSFSKSSPSILISLLPASVSCSCYYNSSAFFILFLFVPSSTATPPSPPPSFYLLPYSSPFVVTLFFLFNYFSASFSWFASSAHPPFSSFSSSYSSSLVPSHPSSSSSFSSSSPYQIIFLFLSSFFYLPLFLFLSFSIFSFPLFSLSSSSFFSPLHLLDPLPSCSCSSSSSSSSFCQHRNQWYRPLMMNSYGGDRLPHLSTLGAYPTRSISGPSR